MLHSKKTLDSTTFETWSRAHTVSPVPALRAKLFEAIEKSEIDVSQSQHDAVSDLSLELERFFSSNNGDGFTILLRGLSGVGKSTVLKIITPVLSEYGIETNDSDGAFTANQISGTNGIRTVIAETVSENMMEELPEGTRVVTMKSNERAFMELSLITKGWDEEVAAKVGEASLGSFVLSAYLAPLVSNLKDKSGILSDCWSYPVKESSSVNSGIAAYVSQHISPQDWISKGYRFSNRFIHHDYRSIIYSFDRGQAGFWYNRQYEGGKASLAGNYSCRCPEIHPIILSTNQIPMLVSFGWNTLEHAKDFFRGLKNGNGIKQCADILELDLNGHVVFEGKYRLHRNKKILSERDERTTHQTLHDILHSEEHGCRFLKPLASVPHITNQGIITLLANYSHGHCEYEIFLEACAHLQRANIPHLFVSAQDGFLFDCEAQRYRVLKNINSPGFGESAQYSKLAIAGTPFLKK